MRIIFNKFFDRVLASSCHGCLVSLALVTGCLEPHGPPENEHADAVKPLENDYFSYKDVRDIFDRQNCTVCHMDDKKLDLRRYPFRWVGVALSPGQEMSEKIWQQLTSRHEPDQGISPLKSADLERLDRWRSQGFTADGPSPLGANAKAR